MQFEEVKNAIKFRFVIKAPEAAPRKDKLKPGVIISEKEDDTIRKYQVNTIRNRHC